MYKKVVFLSVLALILCISTSSRAANIVWVSEALDETGDGIQDDQDWVDLLTSLGHEVYTNPGAWADLDAEEIELMNNADLVIFSRASNSGGYATDAAEITTWNSITAPMILMNAYLVRSSRWLWINSTDMVDDGATPVPTLEAVDLTHPIFTGVAFDAGNTVQAYDPMADSGDLSVIGTTDLGNGDIIAKAAGQDWTLIAEWQEGVEFYAGSGQTAAGHRLLFSAGAQAVTGGFGGAYDLTEQGQKMFVNAIDYMLGAEPRVKAYLPTPSDGAIDVALEPVLSWRSGVFATAHDVYYGTSFDDVNEATREDPRGVLVAQDLEGATFDPEGTLDYGQVVYWRVDEIAEGDSAGPWVGDVWSFTALNYPVIIDDFEGYTDFPPDEIWNTWIDGFGDATNGSTAGYGDPDFVAGEHYVETTIVHSGVQSMPLIYDNSAGLSEVTRTLTEDKNWTVDGVVTLTLFYYGDAANAVVPMYVAVNGSAIAVNPDANAVLAADWKPFSVPLQTFADQGVNLANVNSISIGLGDKTNPVAGGSGMIFIDDIRLYRP